MRWSPSWVLDNATDGDGPDRNQPGQVVLSAGLDRIVEIDGLFDDEIALLHAWSTGGPVDLTDGSSRLVDQLIGLGALIPDTASSTGVVKVVVVSRPATRQLAASIHNRLSRHGGFEATVSDDSGPFESGSMVVALRTHERLPLDRRTDDGDGLAVLHVDLRHEHTLVVGPAELPGLSACDACYDTRLARRWPLPALPDRPSVLDANDLLAELIVFHLDRFASTGTHLVNETIAHSLLDGAAHLDALLRVPACNGCLQVEVTVGRVRLPWHATTTSTRPAKTPQ